MLYSSTSKITDSPKDIVTIVMIAIGSLYRKPVALSDIDYRHPTATHLIQTGAQVPILYTLYLKKLLLFFSH